MAVKLVGSKNKASIMADRDLTPCQVVHELLYDIQTCKSGVIFLVPSLMFQSPAQDMDRALKGPQVEHALLHAADVPIGSRS